MWWRGPEEYPLKYQVFTKSISNCARTREILLKGAPVGEKASSSWKMKYIRRRNSKDCGRDALDSGGRENVREMAKSSPFISSSLW